MLRHLSAALLLAALILSGITAAAQPNSQPLIVVPFEDDTNYVYENGEFRPMDFCQPSGTSRPQFFVYAPDATRFVFQVAAQGAGLAGETYLCDLTTRELSLVAAQPDGNVYRSTPAWSPDGTQLAWVDSHQEINSLDVIVYTLADGSMEVVYSRESRSAAFLSPNLDWGRGGLGFFDVVEDDTRYPVVVFIDPATGESRTFPLSDPTRVNYGRWLEAGQSDLFLLSDNILNGLTVLDPATGEMRTIYTPQLEFYSPAAPDGLTLLATSTLEVGSYEWGVRGADFESSFNLRGNQYGFTLSPDAQQVAFATFEHYPWGGRAYRVSDFSVFPPQSERIDTFDPAYGVPGALYVFWGPLKLRLRS